MVKRNQKSNGQTNAICHKMVAFIPRMLGVHIYEHFAYSKTDGICFYKPTVYDSVLEYKEPETVLKVH